jgi:hypothetical protein
VIEYRWAGNQADRLQALGADLVQRRVAVIVTPGLVATLAAKSATTNIPIVSLSAMTPCPNSDIGVCKANAVGRGMHGLPTPITQPRSAPRQAGLFRGLFTPDEGVLMHVKSVIRTGC